MVLLIKTGDFKRCFFSLENCFLCFALYWFSTFSSCILRKKRPLFLANAHTFLIPPQFGNLWNSSPYSSRQPLDLLALTPHHDPHIPAVPALLGLPWSTMWLVLLGGQCHTPQPQVQILLSLMRETLAKLQKLGLHIGLTLLFSVSLFAIRHAKFYASEKIKSSLQELHQPKTRKEPYKTQSTQLTTC